MRAPFWACAIVAAASACQSGSPPLVFEHDASEKPDGLEGDATMTGDAAMMGDVTATGDVAATVDAPTGDALATEVMYTGNFAASSGVYTLGVGGMSRTVRVHVPASASASPALVIAFHGTNGAAEDFEHDAHIDALSDELGFVAAVPQGEDLQGAAGNADHQSPDLYARMWDLVDRNPGTNRDLLLVRAIIRESQATLRTDARRVYLLGHSNGGFFSYFAAATMAPLVAGFASSCGGVVRCGYRSECSFSRGVGTTCAALASEPGFCAQTCAASSSRMPPLPPGRMPRAFLAHGNRDDVVSVAFTCALAREMGGRAEEQIVDGLTHSLAPDFVRGAWRRLSMYSVSD